MLSFINDRMGKNSVSNYCHIGTTTLKVIDVILLLFTVFH